MSEDQHKAIKIYSVAHVIMFIVFVMHIFYWSMYGTLIKWFCPLHNDVGDASDIKFRELQGLSAYIPQIHRKKIFVNTYIFITVYTSYYFTHDKKLFI